jgi:hypothetical protein
VTTYAVVYSTASKMIRRIISDDDGLITVSVGPTALTTVLVSHHNGLPDGVHLLYSGESAITAIPPSAVRPSGPADWARAVFNATGVQPPTLGAALLDPSNVVQAVIQADATVDAAPDGFTMVQCYSPAICAGCTYDPGTGKFWTAPGSIPPGAPGNADGADPISVPPQEI